MRNPTQKLIDVDKFLTKYHTEQKLYNWLLSSKFLQDYAMLKDAFSSDQEKIKLLESLRDIRNSQLKANRFLFGFRVAIILAVMAAIGLDMAFTGGVGTIVTFAIANPTTIALIGAGAASAIYIVPKIMTQTLMFFYRESERKIFEHSLNLNDHLNLANSATLFKNMQHGWIFDTKRNKTIGTLIKKVMQSITTSAQQLVPAIPKEISPSKAKRQSSSNGLEFQQDFIAAIRSVRQRNDAQKNVKQPSNKPSN